MQFHFVLYRLNSVFFIRSKSAASKLHDIQKESNPLQKWPKIVEWATIPNISKKALLPLMVLAGGALGSWLELPCLAIATMDDEAWRIGH